MIKINLLDWRQKQREHRQKQFLVMLGASAALGAAIVLGVNFKVTGDIEHQNARNSRLQQEIKAMDKQIAAIQKLEKLRSDLLARMRIIEELQRSRTEIVHYFDELVTTTPTGVYLTDIVQKGNQTTVDGVAESHGRVSSYIRNLDGSPWFEAARLIVIKTDPKDRARYNNFKLQFQTKKQKDSAEENAG